MDRKPTTQSKYNPPVRNINRNYISEPKTDYSHIDNIYSKFSTGEYDDIISELNNNQILNFRTDKGETLIHAILRNPSSTLTEYQIKFIIEELVHKNVSINAMNEYNQTAIHLSATKGYYDIISYLIMKKCDINGIDNYGNAPLHYLIDNFIVECKEGEFYKESNKKIKYSESSKLKKYDDYIEMKIIYSLIDKIRSLPSINPINSILLKDLNASIKLYKFFKIEDINQIIANKKIEIENLYKNPSNINIGIDIQKLLLGANTDFMNIYNEFKFDSSKISDNLSDNLDNSLYTNEENKKKVINNFLKNIENFKDEIKLLIPKFRSIYEIFFENYIKIIYLYAYIHQMLLNSVNYYNNNIKFPGVITPGIYAQVFAQIPVIKQLIIDKIKSYYVNIDPNNKLINFDNYADTNILFESSDINIQFKRFKNNNNNDNSPLTFDRKIVGGAGYPIYNNFIDSKDLARFKNTPTYDSVSISDFYIHNRLAIPATDNCKFNSIHNIIKYITKYLTILETNINLANINIEQIPFFQVDYYNEIIINLINNICFLKYQLNKIPTDQIIKDFFEIKNLLNNYKIFYFDYLFDQILINNFIKDKYENIKTLDDIYNSLIKLQKINHDLISNVNEYYSLKFMNKYIEYIKTDFVNETIDNFVYNKFSTYKNIVANRSLTSTFIKYYNDYYDLINNEIRLPEIKRNYLSYYFDYNFNQIYNNKDFTLPVNKIKYQELEIDTTTLLYVLKESSYEIKTEINKYNTGYRNKLYDNTYLVSIISKGIYSTDSVLSKEIDSTTSQVLWLKKDNLPYSIKSKNIPIIGLFYIENIIKLIVSKIVDELVKLNIFNQLFDDVIIEVKGLEIPDKIKKILVNSIQYIKTNPTVSKNIIKEKLIVFLRTNIQIMILLECNKLTNLILTNIKSTNSIKSLLNAKTLLSLENFTKESKYNTLENLIPKLLKKYKSNTLGNITDALIDINTSNITGSNNEKKLLVNKCVVINKIDAINELKFNFRVLDKNGNTIINRLIDQYNIYAINQLLTIDPNIFTYQNHRGQDSITYLYDVIKIIDKQYNQGVINKRYEEYEKNLQLILGNDNTYDEIQLDEEKNIIQSIIKNSLYIFNEYLWLKMLECPNGWTYNNKEDLKKLIASKNKIDIIETILIKTFNEGDKEKIKQLINTNTIDEKLKKMVEELKDEIINLANSNDQYKMELSNTSLIKMISDVEIKKIIKKNDLLITEKKQELTNINLIINKTLSFNFKNQIDNVYTDINTVNLIKETNINFDEYNTLAQRLSNNYLRVILIVNNKNIQNPNTKYISDFSNCLMQLDTKSLSKSDINLIDNYYKKIIDNLYSDYYDIDKYEDSEYNYVNHSMLNCIYLNVINILGIEMLAGLFRYLGNKYTDNNLIRQIVNNYNSPDRIILVENIKDILQSGIITKLNVKNPDKTYVSIDTYKDLLKANLYKKLVLAPNDLDNGYIDKIINFYTFISDNISYNIYQEMIMYMNNLKKRSILIEILKILHN